MSEKFKKIINVLLAYGFEFTIAQDNETNMYFAYHNDKNGKIIWCLDDETHNEPPAIYDGANGMWLNAESYNIEDCVNTIDAICCDYIS